MRVLKLVRRSKKLMTIATVMKNCVSELFLLIVIWAMGVIVFAMLMYSFEEETNPQITSGIGYLTQQQENCYLLTDEFIDILYLFNLRQHNSRNISHFNRSEHRYFYTFQCQPKICLNTPSPMIMYRLQFLSVFDAMWWAVVTMSTVRILTTTSIKSTPPYLAISNFTNTSIIHSTIFSLLILYVKKIYIKQTFYQSVNDYTSM